MGGKANSPSWLKTDTRTPATSRDYSPTERAGWTMPALTYFARMNLLKRRVVPYCNSPTYPRTLTPTTRGPSNRVQYPIFPLDLSKHRLRDNRDGPSHR